MIKDNQKLLNGVHVITDGLILVLAMPLAYWVRFYLMNSSAQDSYGIYFYLMAGALSTVGFLILFSAFGVYKSFRTRSLGQELWIVLKVGTVGMVALVTGLFIMKYIDFSRWLLVVYFLLGLAGLAVKRGFMRYMLHKWRESGRNLKHVVLVGGGVSARRYLDSIRRNRYLGFSAVGFVSDIQTCADLTRLGGYANLGEVLEKYNPDEVVIAMEPEEFPLLDHVITVCECSGIKSSIIPFCYSYLTSSPQIDMVEGVPLINIRRVPLEYIGNAIIKRFIDIFLSALLLILLSPLMLITSLGVKFSSPGPIFFRQERMGRNRKLFNMLKFRSMRVNDTETTGWSTQSDPRRTAFGAFIRKFSIDELPQLVNVLRGDMSLVGPRPELPYFIDQFRTNIPLYMVKHQVRPGITGWAQVNGLRGDSSIQDRILYDIYYIEHWSLLFDLKILFKTACLGFVNSEKVRV